MAIRNFARGRIRAGGRSRIRQAGIGNKRVSMSIPRGMRVNLKVRKG